MPDCFAEERRDMKLVVILMVTALSYVAPLAGAQAHGLSTVAGVPVGVRLDAFESMSVQDIAVLYKRCAGVWRPVGPGFAVKARDAARSTYSWGDGFRPGNTVVVDLDDGLLRISGQHESTRVVRVRKIDDRTFNMTLADPYLRDVQIATEASDSASALLKIGEDPMFLGWGSSLERIEGPDQPDDFVIGYYAKLQRDIELLKPRFMDSQHAQFAVGTATTAILELARNGEFNRLAKYLDPKRGLLLIPGYLMRSGFQPLSVQQLRKLQETAELRTWGPRGDQHDSLTMPIDQYVYSFLKVDPTIGVSSVTTYYNEFRRCEIANIFQYFPESIVAECVLNNYHDTLIMVYLRSSLGWRLAAILSDVQVP
jgi:hypothetical protein